LHPTRHEESERLRRVAGRHNPRLKQLRQAFQGADSQKESAIEGFRMIEEAIRSPVRLRAVFFSESARLRAPRLLPQIGSQVETLLVPDRLFRALVASESPQGIAALVEIRRHSFPDLLEGDRAGPVVVAAGVQDPGNLGTILRSAEAFGARALLVTERTASAYGPKAIRASAGSIFRLPVAAIDSPGAAREMRRRGIRLVATASHKGTPLKEANLSGPLAIFVGNEGAGLDRRLMAEMDELVSIPHSPRVESLNAAISASIVLYEASRNC
jgi:TrmH family RNA methyltransferase